MPARDAKPSAPDTNNALIRLPTWLAVTVMMGLTLVFYHRLWLPGLVLIKRDAFWAGCLVCLTMIARTRWRTGRAEHRWPKRNNQGA